MTHYIYKPQLHYNYIDLYFQQNKHRYLSYTQNTPLAML